MKNTTTFLAILATTALGLLLAGCPAAEDDGIYNSAPWADAGVSLSSSVGLETILDGTGSYDPEESPLTYHWSFESVPADSALVTADITPNDTAESANPTFVVDQQGLYVVRLRVNDGELDSMSAFVHVMADIEGSLPIADASTDQSVTEGDAVNLDGSGSSDPLGNDLTYSWYMVNVPTTSTLTAADIDNGDQASASFVPDAPGVFLIGLQVNNGITDSVPDFMSVDVTSTNSCPDAAAEAVSELHSCSPITVTAAGSSDPDNDVLDYSWRHLLPPFESDLTESEFDDPAAEETLFFADVPGTYTLQVSVNDGECESTPYQFDVEISIRPSNNPPVPDADGTAWYNGTAPCTQSGQDWWCTGCDEVEVTIDGSGSTDPDGDPLSFYWENLYDPNHPGWESYSRAEIDDPYAEIVTATLRDASAEYQQQTPHQYEFMLTVTDCMGEEVSLASSFGIVYNCEGILAP